MSGAGKSTVCSSLCKRFDDTINCDEVARLVASNPVFLNEIRERFSGDVINPDGTLNRAETARLIFSDNKKRALYNQIIFPYITFEIIKRIKLSGKTVILDAPTLFESGLDILCTKIISVTADFDVCVERISKRDNISIESARARLKSQHDAEFFRKNSDYVIINNGTQDELEKKADDMVKKIIGEL